jgi:hypothetical protein
MGRIRTIKPEFPQSESMGNVSREARLCFVLMWTIADDLGRLRGDSRLLASLLYPYDGDISKNVNKWVEELSLQECVTRYEVDGKTYIQIKNWASHQKIDRPSDSKIPHSSEAREDSTNTQRGLVLGKEGKGREEEGNGMESPAEQNEDLTLDGLVLRIKAEYPKRLGGSGWTPKVIPKLKAVPKDEWKTIIRGVIGYRHEMDKAGNIGTEFVKHIQTFFNNECWREFSSSEFYKPKPPDPEVGVDYRIYRFPGVEGPGIKYCIDKDEPFNQGAWERAKKAEMGL